MNTPKQPEVNIGMIGHVDHGKTTLTKTLTGVWTDRHSEEIKRGITIKLGYADAAFYRCPKCSGAEAYSTKTKCPICGAKTEFLRAVSFVDAPGHETLMATTLSGASLMNGALLLIAANEECPQPQTQEHFMALNIVDIKNIIIVQNKIDLVSEERALENYRQIKEFVKGTFAEDAPIIPVSAHHDVNLDVLIQAIEEHIPSPKLHRDKPLRMYVVRSFDVNTPGTPPDRLVGGVLGGAIIQGELAVGDEVEIAPGEKVNGTWENLFTEVTSLKCGGRSVKKAHAGGLVGIGTLLDPYFTKSDGMIGRVVGKPDTLPQIWESFSMEFHTVERIVGVEDKSLLTIKPKDPLMLTMGTATTVGVVTRVREDIYDLRLKRATCFSPENKIGVSKRIRDRWRLVGYGIIK